MFQLSVVTLEKVIYEGQVSSVMAPGSDGYLELLTNHAPIITSLQPGKLTFVASDGKRFLYAIGGGFLEMSANVASVLADSIESPENIDLKRAEDALARAENRLADPAPHKDLPRIQNALKRAKNRIKLKRELIAQTSRQTL